ncbi:MAG: HlyD family secretion protein [Steroidobacteraceae bacterium]|nr:HlyD family secretion protein [Steroidobacteraceae bacterium]
MAGADSTASAAGDDVRAGWRRRVLLLAGPVLLAIGSVGWYLAGGRYIATDNAYLRADFVVVSPRIDGVVTDVRVRSDQEVRAGDVLFTLDAAPLDVAVARAEADLATVRNDLEAVRAELGVRRAELESAGAAAAYREREARRLEGLAERGIASRVSYDAALEELRAARDRVRVGERLVQESIAALDGRVSGPLDAHPRLQLKAASLAEARLQRDYATVRAATDGQVGRVELHPGERLQAGEPALRVVVSAQPYLEANLKETQLGQLVPGQPATVRIDAYPGRTWHARVASISPATGAEFSLLPPENASGNWVKIVQRVPVRLEFEDDPAAGLLRAGMSAEVRIDTGPENQRLRRLRRGG